MAGLIVARWRGTRILVHRGYSPLHTYTDTDHSHGKIHNKFCTRARGYKVLDKIELLVAGLIVARWRGLESWYIVAVVLSTHTHGHRPQTRKNTS